MVMDTTAPGPYFSVALTDELSSTFLGRGNRDASCGNAPRMCGISQGASTLCSIFYLRLSPGLTKVTDASGHVMADLHNLSTSKRLLQKVSPFLHHAGALLEVERVVV
jgi:hypothetical protein